MDQETNRQPNPQRTVILQDESLKQFQGGFTAIPNRILRNSDLSLGARMTYAMLLQYAWQDNFCFPAQESIAHDLGVTSRSVRTFLSELREGRLIEWKQQGLNRPNIYYILRLPETRQQSRMESGPEKFSAPDRKSTSGQDRKPASDYEYSITKTHNVNVGLKSTEPVDNSLSDQDIREEYIIDQMMEQLDDRNPKSRKAYRLIVRSLGSEIIWRLLGNTKEANRDGSIEQSKAQYFMGMAKNVAKDQGLPLNFRSAAPRA